MSEPLLAEILPSDVQLGRVRGGGHSGKVASYLGLSILVGIVTCAIFAPLIAPHSPYATNVLLQNIAPSLRPHGKMTFILGTDGVGRDELSRLIFGSRISLLVGAASVGASGAVGTLLGLIAGYYRGIVPALIMRLVDLQLALPSLLIALFILYVIGSSAANVVIVLAVTRWPIYVRLVRSLVLELRERRFMEALKQVGASDIRVLLRHALPNVAAPLVALAVLEIANMILIEASLDFLGLGVQPPAASWGLMLSEGLPYITSAWWLVTFPGVAIMLTALSFIVMSHRLGALREVG